MIHQYYLNTEVYNVWIYNCQLNRRDKIANIKLITVEICNKNSGRTHNSEFLRQNTFLMSWKIKVTEQITNPPKLFFNCI